MRRAPSITTIRRPVLPAVLLIAAICVALAPGLLPAGAAEAPGAPLAASAPSTPPAAPTPPAPPAPPSPPAPSPGCIGAEHRQFDFWAGTWDVFGPRGRQVGSNTITPLLDGCVLQERWSGSGGSEGTSLNAYDAAARLWRQTWIDNGGNRLELSGTFRDGSMVLTGETKGGDGARVQERITWTPLPGGKVRQLWEQSKDAGANWTVAFDGAYVRKGTTPAAAPSSDPPAPHAAPEGTKPAPPPR